MTKSASNLAAGFLVDHELDLQGSLSFTECGMVQPQPAVTSA